jgi:hypothetical protein
MHSCVAAAAGTMALYTDHTVATPEHPKNDAQQCVQLLMCRSLLLCCRVVVLLQDVTPGLLDYAVATCDPEVVAELLARQEDFPKVTELLVPSRTMLDLFGMVSRLDVALLIQIV